MNSIWNKNITLLKKRFPYIIGQLNLASLLDKTDITGEIPQKLKAPLEIVPSRVQGFPTAKEGGKYLHSAYNPLREAEQAAKALHDSVKNPFGAAFFGAGLGYTALAYARLFPSDTVIIAESDIRYFLTALSVIDWADFFSSKNIVLALCLPPDQVITLIEQCGGFNHILISENKAQTFHAEEYFTALNALIERNRQKLKINNSTLEKFSLLWQRNSCKNLYHLAEKDGINIYKNKLNPKVPALILAAGPTLAQTLPFLKELKKRTVLIAVDTALRACLKSGVEPDFIILADPQYYAYRHIAGLSSPSSVLVTESAAYPPVFRFNCRKIVMCSSMFPLGKFVESKLGSKGTLSAGGSVSTTAWDFARTIGAKDIVFSGLDLGFPDYETHIRGSTFEEKIHQTSNRLNPAEKAGAAYLFGAGAETAADYSGKQILTDGRMKMFAWWFESKQAEYASDSVVSYSLSERSLKIPGFKVLDIKKLLALPELTHEKEDFFNSSESNKDTAENKEKFTAVMNMIHQGLNELYSLADEGEALSVKAISLKDAQNKKNFALKLSQIDAKITASQFKDIASLVFPTESQLEKIFKDTVFSKDELTATFERSKLIYGLVKKSVKAYQKNLK